MAELARTYKKNQSLPSIHRPVRAQEGCPARFIGVLDPNVATCCSSNVDGIRGVQMGPGATPFTRMPFVASEADKERQKQR